MVDEGETDQFFIRDIKKEISSLTGKTSLVFCESESEVDQSCPTLCDPMDTRLLRPWDFLGKSTGVGCHFLLQGFFLTQGSRIVDRRFTV